MGSKDLYSIREWSPLNLNERIPASISRGFFSIDVKFTCVDAIEKYLAIGSDVCGVVFWYNRETGETQKLRTEVASRITCVKIVDSVEYMVAAGCSNGQVNVFQIQKPMPPELEANLVAPCTRSKPPIERYTIRDLHRTPITCLEWSKNGMKLYSGDWQGIVVQTDFDYQAHLSKSIEIISEAYEIVQLNVHQCHLLVSTLYRAIVCQRNIATGEWLITQVGKKDRKQLIDCGGVFLKRNNSKLPKLISGRPGLRFWLADTAGNVEKTFLFREAVARSPTWEIPILNPKTKQNQRFSTKSQMKENNGDNGENDSSSRNFRNFYLYAGQDTLIVTHDEINLYILNLDRLRVEAVARGFRKILDFCVCDKEILVLEGERSLLRLAPLPEKPNKTAQIIFNPLLPPPIPFLGAAAAGVFESPVEFEPEESTIVSAEECFELPPIEALNLNIPIELAVESPRAEQNRRMQIFNQISEQKFEDSILHRSGLLINGRNKRKSKSSERKNKESTGIVEIGHVANANEDVTTDKPTTQTTHATLMEASYCQPKQVQEEQEQNIRGEKEVEKEVYKESELSLPHLSPIAVEEFERAQALANLMPLNFNATTTQNIKSPTLKLEYPKQKLNCLEDAGVQTTPPKKIYYIQHQHTKEEQQDDLETMKCDYSNGEPIDEILPILRATNLIQNDEIDEQQHEELLKESPLKEEQQNSRAKLQSQLQFVAAQPASEGNLSEIHSFLPDFRRIRDPMRKSPPPSGDSGTSSEWEFLDN